MSSDVHAVLDSYIGQLEAMAERLEHLWRQSKGQSTPAEDKLYGGLAEAVGQEVFEYRGGGKLFKGLHRLLKESDQQTILRERQAIDAQFRQLLGNLDAYLATVSIMTPHLKPASNSQRLRKKLAACYGASRIETRINKAIQALHSIKSEELVRNTDIQKALAGRYAEELGNEAYETLRRLETGLRGLIVSKLEALTPDWWNRRIPEDVRHNAEERMQEDSGPWPWESMKAELIEYVDFTDYVKIVTRRDNWKEVFVHVFGDEETISSKLKELDPIRKSIAHSRKLSSHELSRLQIYAHDILGAIGKA